MDARDLVEIQTDIVEEFRSGARLRSPIRCALEASSDFDFVATLSDTVAEQLKKLGLQSGLAPAMTWEVLAQPSVAMVSTDTSGHRFRQAVVFSLDDGSTPYDLRVVVDALILPRRQNSANKRTPPDVASAEVTIELFDLSDDRETARLIRELLEWCLEFPTPLSDNRTRPGQVAFIGNPKQIGMEEVPDSWRQRLSLTAAMFSLSAEVKEGPAYDGTLSAKTTLVVKLDPYAGKKLVIPANVQHFSVSARGRTFESILDDIVIRLVEAAAALADSEPAVGVRDLLPGERVYHRKIGSSRAFDRFNEGSPEPCSHGEGAFVSWRGPKATKGLARRYSNFEPSMHKHCGRYPTCGMYAVFA